MATHANVLVVDDLLELPAPESGIGWEFVDGRPVPVIDSCG